MRTEFSESGTRAEHLELSLVIPTYNERPNIPLLLDQLLTLFSSRGTCAEIIVVDDDSPDGTGELVDGLARSDERVRVIHRSGKLGLTSAVIEGFAVARGEVLGVMDADLSHPPSAVLRMLEVIENDADFVIGSRYVKGGETVGWPRSRRFVSWVACQLARPFTPVRDPMSGFFLIRRGCMVDLELTAKGFKIVLDLLVNATYECVAEVPISFVDRQHGVSKISRGEVFNLLRSLAGYARRGASGRQARHIEVAPLQSTEGFSGERASSH